MAQHRLQLGIVAEGIVGLETKLTILLLVQTEADSHVLPALAVRSMRGRVFAAFLSVIAELLAIVLRGAGGDHWVRTTFDRLELGVVTLRIVGLKAVTVGLAVIQAKADRWILPALAVGTMSVRVLATRLRLVTDFLAVAGVVMVSSNEIDETQEASFLVHEI